uniref:Uncharacterized protein n=1 Tax=Arcella intermedia TaxID=1963864 RepID=A0A6B2LCF0_9EUKA
MEDLLSKTSLSSTVSGKSLFICERVQSSKSNTEHTTQILFEDNGVGTLHISRDGSLPLYSCGIYTGVVCDIGDGASTAVPFFDGDVVGGPMSVGRVDLSGMDVTSYLTQRILYNGMVYENPISQFQDITTIKETYCYVTTNLKTRDIEKTTYKSKYGTTTIGSERFQCPEVLFKPYLIKEDIPSIVDMIFKSITQCPKPLHKALFGNIILCGGSTLLPGFDERLLMELRGLQEIPIPTNICPLKDRVVANWEGGCVLSGLPIGWLTKEEYEECGPAIVEKLFYRN